MKRQPYFKYYQVLKPDTTVTEISTNDFKPVVQRFVPNTQLSLVQDSEIFYGNTSLVHALEKAKKGAQEYIGQLIKEGEPALPRLLQYRIDHYEDLWFNLVDNNLRRLEAELKLNKNFKWTPYRIHI
ncbi:hypothetical protein KXD93_14440 [Mucilaginibacter sp. BJC16-A38]|uniref:hypothetical protein n=1 Tax=Mucilaginibacter phenanthrenivorans TaxID=1234842 RepID=UPI002157C9A5|nr:hypothetical protein [Mucilaginibacter phenanthrenivorans]MCR8558853.1 hypothetical protein [Mucilaginibacter phenanthrenivorans]